MTKGVRKYLLFFLFTTILPVLVTNLQVKGGMSARLADWFSSYQSIFYIVGGIGSFASGIFYFLLIRKEKQSNRIAGRAARSDMLWIPEELRKHCRLTLYHLFHSWRNGDPDQLAHFATAEFLEEFRTWERGAVNRGVDITNPVEVTESRIIACNDSSVNDEDSYKAFVAGNFLFADGLHSINEAEVTKVPFALGFEFVRVNDFWKLNRIDHKVTLADLLLQRNKMEL